MSFVTTELKWTKKTIKIVAVTGAILFIAPELLGDAFVELGHGCAELFSGLLDVTWDAMKEGAKEYATEQLHDAGHKFIWGLDPRNWFKG